MNIHLSMTAIGVVIGFPLTSIAGFFSDDDDDGGWYDPPPPGCTVQYSSGKRWKQKVVTCKPPKTAQEIKQEQEAQRIKEEKEAAERQEIKELVEEIEVLKDNNAKLDTQNDKALEDLSQKQRWLDEENKKINEKGKVTADNLKKAQEDLNEKNQELKKKLESLSKQDSNVEIEDLLAKQKEFAEKIKQKLTQEGLTSKPGVNIETTVTKEGDVTKFFIKQLNVAYDDNDESDYQHVNDKPTSSVHHDFE